jgi:hypothetical protein
VRAFGLEPSRPLSSASARSLQRDSAGSAASARARTESTVAHAFSGLPVLGPTTGPVLQRQPASDPPWDSSLLTITLASDRENCLGIATPSSIDRYSNCGSPVRPPFCQSARVPFTIDFYVDRAGRPHPRPQAARSVSAKFEFTTTGGAVTYRRAEADDTPRYAGPNLSLEPRFGRAFTVGSTESGRLTVALSLVDEATSVRYDDRIDYEITPCV